MFVQPRDDPLPICGFVGNSDVYGLGIRVGIYLQWVSSLLSKAFLDEEALRDVLNENAIFLLAIFLATILLVTDTISGVHSLDVLIMLHIFFGSIFTVFLSANLEDRIEYFSSLVGIIFKTGMVTGMAAVGVWFWFIDIQPPLDPTCSSFAFLFGRVGLYGNHTIMAFKAFSSINLVYCSLFLLGMIGIRISVFVFTLALKDLNRPIRHSSVAGAELLSILVRKSLTDKKKLLNDLRVLGAELIVQSTIPSEGKYLKDLHKLVERNARENPLGASNWQAVKGKLLQNQLLANSRIFHAFVKIGDVFDGEVSNTNGKPELFQPIWPITGPMILGSSAAGRESGYIEESQDRLSDKEMESYRLIGGLVLNSCAFIYSIISIELLLRYNSITEVYTILSTGQIIPFIIGIAGLWRTVWKIIVRSIQAHIIAKRSKEGTDTEPGTCAVRSGDGSGSSGSALAYESTSTQTGDISKNNGDPKEENIEPV